MKHSELVEKYEQMPRQNLWFEVARDVLKALVGKVTVRRTDNGIEVWPSGTPKRKEQWSSEQRATLETLGVYAWGIPWERADDVVSDWLATPHVASTIRAAVLEAAQRVDNARKLEVVAKEFGAERVGQRGFDFTAGWRVETNKFGDYDFGIGPNGVFGRTSVAPNSFSRTGKINLHSWEASPARFKMLLQMLGARAPHPRLYIDDTEVLGTLAGLEGDDWNSRQWADMQHKRDLRAVPANQLAFDVLRSARHGDDYMNLWGAGIADVMPGGGIIEGMQGRAYAILPSGEIVLLSETATPEFVSRAAQAMRIA
jgi:hypothetical protein